MRWLRKEILQDQAVPQTHHSNRQLDYAEFELKRMAVYCLLALFVVDSLFALVIAGRIATGGAKVSVFVIGGLLTWTVGRTGSLLNVMLKSIFR